jgi:hypothetical protein
MGPITGVDAGDKSAFSIHCYRSMLAIDFAAECREAGEGNVPTRI